MQCSLVVLLALAACSGREPHKSAAPVAVLASAPVAVVSSAPVALAERAAKWRGPPPISAEFEPAQTDYIPPAGFVVLASAAPGVSVTLVHSGEDPWAILQHAGAACSSIAFWRWSGTRLGHVPALESGAPALGEVHPSGAPSPGKRVVIAIRSGRQGNTWLHTRTTKDGMRSFDDDGVHEIWEHDGSTWARRKRYAPGLDIRFTLARPAGGLLVALARDAFGRDLELELLGVDTSVSTPQLPPAPDVPCEWDFSSIQRGRYFPGGELVLIGPRCKRKGFSIARWHGGEVTHVTLEDPLDHLPKGGGAYWFRIESESRVTARALGFRGDAKQIRASFENGKWIVSDVPYDDDSTTIFDHRVVRKKLARHHDPAKLRDSVRLEDGTQWLAAERVHFAEQVVVSDEPVGRAVHLTLAPNTCR